MEQVPTVPYAKQQDCYQRKYIGFLNPTTYWKMTKLYYFASIKKTLLDISKTFNIITMIKKLKTKGKEL